MAAVSPLQSYAAPPLLVPTRFQKEAISTISEIIKDTANKIAAAPSRRAEIALAQGVTLLTAPTASGKTLITSRAIEASLGLPDKVCWLWFSPFTGLVSQTKDVIAAQCPRLRVLDLTTDRSPDNVLDGDVFVSTWASVATQVADTRSLRRSSETAPSLDLLLESLRTDGWYIGAVIDEAHLNFSQTAKQAAAFYLQVARPDFTILATATPHDEKLEQFARSAGISQINRISIPRELVVKEGLNKIGVKAIHFRAEAKDEKLIDLDEVAVLAALERHNFIKQELHERGQSVTPLMLVQVENDDKGGDAQISMVKDLLTAHGVPETAIATHTSKEQDPFFHTLAFDEHVEVLIFKLSAATGFDAPRAWCLVSLRRSAAIEFGIQVIGRIMRVHPALQPSHPCISGETPGQLDIGYLFLSNPEAQKGLAGAADQIKSIHEEISTVTDNVVVVDFGSHSNVLLNPREGFVELLRPTDDHYGTTEGSETGDGDSAADQAHTANEMVNRIQPLFTGLPDAHRIRSNPNYTSRGGSDPAPAPGFSGHRIRSDLPFELPLTLAREVMPRDMEDLARGIAERFEFDADILALVHRTRGKVSITEEDLFGEEGRTQESARWPLSNQRINTQAQQSFRFNESIDERDLKPALLERLRAELERAGQEVPDEKELRRAVNLIAIVYPKRLHAACARCLTQIVEVRQDESVPEYLSAPEDAEKAVKNVYGIFPAGMNNEETAFARQLDEDTTGTVQWWLRNVSQARWAVSIVLPNGRSFFPDFVVGVDPRRKSEGSIALVEVKDDGSTGRLFATVNTDKVRTVHQRYKSALMVCRTDDQEWYRVVYRPDLSTHQIGEKFSINDLAVADI